MHSSTSNSSERAPQGMWPSTWWLALLLVLLVAGAWEGLCRSRGLDATYTTDSGALWAKTRQRASLLGKDAVILVGASRMQMDVNLDAMRAFTGTHPVQLAISANPFLPVLEDLARDDAVTGTVIVSITAQDLLAPTTDTSSKKWIAQYEGRKALAVPVAYRRVEEFLTRNLDSVWVSRAAGATPQQVLLGGGIKSYVRTLADRSQHADYQKIDRIAAYERRIQLVLDGQEAEFREIPDFDHRIRRLESLFNQITRRGGRVVVVRMPSWGRIWEIDEARYPREVYWDRLAAFTAAETIHFKDYPSLSSYVLPDGVHLDFRDAVPFTRALCQIIFGSVSQGR